VRAFIAIGLPEDLRAELAARQEEFRSALSSSRGRDSGARWALPEGIHLTLKFLGEISDAKASQVATGLVSLGAFPGFTVEVRGFGFFPDSRRPRVFWAGVLAPPALAALAGRIETAMANLGFPPEGRSFSPHLTLARLKSPQPVLESIARESAARALGRFVVSEFALFESKLSPGRPAEYRNVARFAALPALPSSG
jgi:2'-5' RNA ligase